MSKINEETRNRIKEQKIENLMEMDYKNTKSRLAIKNDYAFYFVDDNDTIISIGPECAFAADGL